MISQIKPAAAGALVDAVCVLLCYEIYSRCDCSRPPVDQPYLLEQRSWLCGCISSATDKYRTGYEQLPERMPLSFRARARTAAFGWLSAFEINSSTPLCHDLLRPPKTTIASSA